MSKILSGLAFFVLAVQFVPINHQMFIPNVLADESQEMVERAPLILQAAYEGNWQKVINIAKKNRNSLKDVDDMGNTVLHQAAAHAQDAIVIELLKLGADKNAKNNTSQQTRPYDYAQRNKKLSTNVRNMLR